MLAYLLIELVRDMVIGNLSHGLCPGKGRTLPFCVVSGSPLARASFQCISRQSKPLHRQIYERLRCTILSGQLQAGQRLPSTRTLASELAVSRNTASWAYEQLFAEGYLQSKVGQGTTVASQIPEELLAVSPVSPRGTAFQKSPAVALSCLGSTIAQVQDIPS